MALAELLRVTHRVHGDVKVVDGKVESVQEKVEDMGDKVGDKVQCVDEKVQVIIDGARGVSSSLPVAYNSFTFRSEGGKIGGEGSENNYPTDGKQRRRSEVFVIS